MSFLSSVAKGVTGGLNTLYTPQIALWGCAILLASTTLLGYLLKCSYEAQGRLQSEKIALVQKVKAVEEALGKRDASCKASETVVAEAAVDKGKIDKDTKKAVKALNANHPTPTKEANDASGKKSILDAELDDVTYRLLRDRYSELQAGDAQ